MKRYPVVSILFLWCVFSQSQSLNHDQSGVRIMFYNVENFFDLNNDTLTEDDDFLPHGVMRWSYKRYSNKLNSLYKTIIAAGEWEPPVIIGLCEIEKRQILEDLIFDTYLSKFKYGVVHEDSPDRRGIDVCLIYRNDKIRLIDYNYWTPLKNRNEVFNSRSVLYSKFLIGTDTLHLILNHWPSRRGGVLEGEGTRSKIAAMVREKLDSIMNIGSNEKIIVSGDFNCTPGDEVLRTMVNSSDSVRNMINLSGRLEISGSGTYRYMGTWEMIDQMIINKNLLVCRHGYYTREDLLTIFGPDFLMKKDPKYPGESPFPTYHGYRYQGGFSDHLPILLDLKVR